MTKGQPNHKTKVLVSAASKHSSTTEIADHIGRKLRERGLDVTISPPDQVEDVADYEAVVLGSAVYAGHWMKDARALADRIATADPRPAVWLFSSGPIGDPPKPEDDPVDVEPILEMTSARGHCIFAGKIDKSELSLGEKAIMVAVKAPEGDFRDWDEIVVWADEIADDLE